MTSVTSVDLGETSGEGVILETLRDAAKDPKYRCWCFTLNNYTEEEWWNLKTSLEERNYKYVIGQEVGEEGTPHIQGYIKSKHQIKFSTVKYGLLFGRAHCEKAKGSEAHNLKYCSKEGKFFTNMIVEDNSYKGEDLLRW